MSRAPLDGYHDDMYTFDASSSRENPLWSIQLQLTHKGFGSQWKSEKKKGDWQGKGNREISFPSLTQSRLKLKSSSPNLGKSSLLYLSSAFTFLLKLDLIWSYQFENQWVNLASRMVTRHFYYILNMVLALLQSLLAFSKSAYLLRAPSRKCDVLSKPFGWCLGVANFIHIHEPTHYPPYLGKS